MFLVASACPHLHEYYDDYTFDGITYMGMTEDEEVAEAYAEQFSPQVKVYYTEVDDNFIAGLHKKFKDLLISTISEYSSLDDKKTILLSDGEVEFMDTCLEEPGMDFDDLKYAIETLEPYRDKRVNRIRKELKKIYRAITCNSDEGSASEKYMNDILGSVDVTRLQIFVSSRIGLFDYWAESGAHW